MEIDTSTKVFVVNYKLLRGVEDMGVLFTILQFVIKRFKLLNRIESNSKRTKLIVRSL